MNPDGHGWAIADDGLMHLGKSMVLAEALETFAKARAKHPGGHALFHSRWATHGDLNVGNVHPFLVGGSHQTVVAHNGVLPWNAHPHKGDDRSDTRKFADEILSRQYRRLDKPGAFNALTSWAGRANKLVILTVDQRYRKPAYLVNEREGHWDPTTGIWHSNHDYLYIPQPKTSIGRWVGNTWQPATTAIGAAIEKAIARDRYGYTPCIMCFYGDVDPHTGYCYECGSCQDCTEAKPDCLCYCSEPEFSHKMDLDDERWLTAEEARVVNIAQRMLTS